MRIYATEDDGTKHLVALECDECGARIKPNPKINESGWIKLVTFNVRDIADMFEWHYCEEHSCGRG